MIHLLNLILLGLVLQVRSSFSLECWKCKESETANCALNMTLPDSKITSVNCDTGVCVTFKNKYDGGRYQRDCSNNLWIPPTGIIADETKAELPTCIKDKYSLELFCFCATDKCNTNNVGLMSVYDVNECSSNPCLNAGTCSDSYGKFICKCIDFFDGPTCDRCKLGYTGIKCDQQLAPPCNSNPCLNSGTCTSNPDYTYKCDCNGTGFSGVRCESEINDCEPNPCSNGGKCIDGKSTYTCNCNATGYKGAQCTDDVNECMETPTTIKCITNQGTCVNTLGSYDCTCVTGFTGEFCEVNIDNCASQPCKNGTCIDDVDSYRCVCNPGFMGFNCDTIRDYCNSFPCQNGGSCTNFATLGKYSCNCVEGYTGVNCEIKQNACAQQPCYYGTCTEGVTYPQFTCACDAGWSGATCDVEINECLSSPCKFGNCVNLFNSYKCYCQAGYTGVNCDVDIDECASNPCYDDGTNKPVCVNLVNSFKCNCAAGYTGLYCEQDVNECASNPCLNNGKCVNKLNKYECVCNLDFYEGLRCERPVYRCYQTPDPCNGNGDCFGGVGTEPIRCQCKTGYTGQFCETKQQPCDTTNPCLNGGKCLNDALAVDGYSCVCPSGYSGSTCEQITSACLQKQVFCFNDGKCVDSGSDYFCDCKAGYSGTFCQTQHFQCRTQGTFADPLYCSDFITCISQTDGTFKMESQTCPLLSTIQLLFDPTNKTCVLPSKYPTGQTCQLP